MKEIIKTYCGISHFFFFIESLHKKGIIRTAARVAGLQIAFVLIDTTFTNSK